MTTRKHALEQISGFAAVLAFWFLFAVAIAAVTCDVAGGWDSAPTAAVRQQQDTPAPVGGDGHHPGDLEKAL